MPSVLQGWVHEIPFMQQSVLLTAIRGPDGMSKMNEVRPIVRWLRRCILISAFDKCALTTPHDPRGGNFTGPSFDEPLNPEPSWRWQATMKAIEDVYVANIDAYPAHFQNHLKDAAQVLGFRHPSSMISHYWLRFHERLVRKNNALPETAQAFDKRLGDNRENWLAFEVKQ